MPTVNTVMTHAGAVVITRWPDLLVVAGPSGVHRVRLDRFTNANAHIAGFIQVNGGLVVP
tara:strand:- start:316 stop:495 length:180 start_codon:yes stop_codon:yes gene_type:complete